MSGSERFKTVADVAGEGLCCFCGGCEGACPAGAVSLQYEGSFPVPKVDFEKCTNCGLCVEVCPGHGVDFDSLNEAVFGAVPTDKILGHCLGFYVGAAKDDEARLERTSGGIAKETAIWGLETGRWDGVAVSRFCGGDFRRTETFIATTRQEVCSASSSLYCPVPACSSWQEIRNFEGKVCFVGLPCHLHALRKAQRHIKWLREKVVFSIGLFCSGTPGFWATEAFLSYHGIEAGEVESFEYRGKGWPGEICVKVRGRVEARSFKRMNAKRLSERLKTAAAFLRRSAFVHRRCLICPDHVAELADISLGDAWHMGYEQEKSGLNIAIVRTKNGADVVEGMCSGQKVFTDEVERGRVIQSQKACLSSKKKLGPVFELMKRYGSAVPVFTGQPDLSINRRDCWLAWYEWNQTRISYYRRLWRLLLMTTPIMALLRRINKAKSSDLSKA